MRRRVPRYAGAVSARYRLRPPPVEVSPPLVWALGRAFGPVEAELPPVVGRDAVALARRFDLGARIAARTRHARLAREVGEEAASELRHRFRHSAASVLVLERVARAVAETAAEIGVPVVLLKGMALHLTGRAVPGSRPLSDVDALVPRDAARRLQEELVTRGWREADLPPSEHQLPPLHHPAGPVVEIHRALRGVRLAGKGAAADAADLLAAGLAEPAPGMPEGCHVPAADALAAHLLVHALAQHLEVPRSYPLLRLIADLQDLGWDDARREAFLAGPHRWIAHDVPAEAAADAAALAARLARGEPPAVLAGGDDGPARLLRHALAGELDGTYRAALRWSAIAAPGGVDDRRTALLHTLVHALWLTDGQIERIYGPPRSRLGHWALRLWRPFDLLLRGVRYGAAWSRHRLRRSRRTPRRAIGPRSR